MHDFGLSEISVYASAAWCCALFFRALVNIAFSAPRLLLSLVFVRCSSHHSTSSTVRQHFLASLRRSSWVGSWCRSEEQELSKNSPMILLGGRARMAFPSPCSLSSSSMSLMKCPLQTFSAQLWQRCPQGLVVSTTGKGKKAREGPAGDQQASTGSSGNPEIVCRK